jgi:hypothetical protein
MDEKESADLLAKVNRVSIRAVLVQRGQDAAKALVENGILDPVEVPFVFGDASMASGGVMSDGRTPNLFATLELDDTDPADAAPKTAQPAASPRQDTDETATGGPPSATTLPAGFGSRPLAPVRKRLS